MDNEILKEILAELKGHSVILKEHSAELRSIKKDVSEIQTTIHKYLFADIARLEKRVEILEEKAG